MNLIVSRLVQKSFQKEKTMGKRFTRNIATKLLKTDNESRYKVE